MIVLFQLVNAREAPRHVPLHTLLVLGPYMRPDGLTRKVALRRVGDDLIQKCSSETETSVG